jgi:RND family efflux transporter MFP subunit
MKLNLQAFFRLIPVYLLLLAVASCSNTEQQKQTQNKNAEGQRGGRGGRGRGAGEAVAVKTTTVQRIAIQRMVDLSGSLVSPDQVRVSSEVSGIISSINADLGEEVQSGQVLLQLDTRELQLAVERAESALRQTEAQLGIDSARSSSVPPDDQIASVRTANANRDDARIKLRQTQEQVTKGLLPRADLDTVETRLKVAEASVQSALENVRALKASLQDRRAALELARKKVADASVRAPASGAISERLVQKGEFIRENTQVVTIVQLNPLKLQTAVQEKYADIIHRNLPVQFKVEPFPNEVFQGRVANISPSINDQTRTFPVEILVANPNRKLKPGFFAKGAILTTKDQNVMAVPQEALSTLAGVSSVYVIENGAVRQQNVTLGVQEGLAYEVLDGLKGNEVLAASSLNEITSGTKVTMLGDSSSPKKAAESADAPKDAPGKDGKPSGDRRKGSGRGKSSIGDGGNN